MLGFLDSVRSRSNRILTLVAAIGLAACTTVEREPASQAMVRALSAAGGDRCLDTAASVLQGLGVEPGNIDRVETDRRSNTSGDDEQLQGYTIWTSLKGRQGYVVTFVRPDCDFASVYDRGEIEIENGKVVN